MSRTSDKVIRENALRMLMFIREETSRARSHVAPLSYRQMARGLGLSIQQVRFLSMRLEEEGLVASTPRYAEDGGQLANGYALTSRGRLLLREARKLETTR